MLNYFFFFKESMLVILFLIESIYFRFSSYRCICFYIDNYACSLILPILSMTAGSKQARKCENRSKEILFLFDLGSTTGFFTIRLMLGVFFQIQCTKKNFPLVRNKNKSCPCCLILLFIG